MKIEIPEIKKKVYEMVIPMRWGDMDAMGHVNNTVYFRYMEIIDANCFHSIGCEPSPLGQGPVIVNAFCNFYKQLEYPGNVLVKMYVSDPGRTTFESWCTPRLSPALAGLMNSGKEIFSSHSFQSSMCFTTKCCGV